jgi:DNA invertase Pin-like site-specific DNA recombinase
MDRDNQPAVLRGALRRWGGRQRNLATERDPLVLAALEAGISREEVHILTGLGRTTIDRIVTKGEQE